MSDKKGYWLAHVTVTDPATYDNYRALAPAAIEAFGGRFLARGGAYEVMEGAEPRSRHVVIEFPSMQAAIDCHRSDAYQRARAERLSAGDATILIVEGI